MISPTYAALFSFKLVAESWLRRFSLPPRRLAKMRWAPATFSNAAEIELYIFMDGLFDNTTTAFRAIAADTTRQRAIFT